MAGIVSVSRKDLAQRRQKLRQQRRLKIVQTIWRTLAVSGITGGLFWVTLQPPMWVLETPSQIEMRLDDKLLSTQKIESLLLIPYPQSLWRIEPSEIADTLESQPAIAQATVSRRMFPPGLIINIQEKSPVAMTYNLKQSRKNQSNPAKQEDISVLDAQGSVIPWNKYKVINPHAELPTLKVIGKPEEYRSYWNRLYQFVSESPVQVTEIHCQDPTNLVIKTELGNVHLGVPTQLTEKFYLLAQIQHSTTKFNSKQIAYIDLKNPHQPLVQMN